MRLNFSLSNDPQLTCLLLHKRDSYVQVKTDCVLIKIVDFATIQGQVQEFSV